MTKDEITYLQAYYHVLEPIIREKESIEIYKGQLDKATKSIPEKEKELESAKTNLEETKSRSKEEMTALLNYLFQDHGDVLHQLDSIDAIDFQIQFLGKKYPIFNLSLPRISRLEEETSNGVIYIYKNDNSSFIENYAMKFIEHYKDMSTSNSFRKLIDLVSLVNRNFNARNIIVNREMKKKEDSINAQIQKLTQEKILTEEHIMVLKKSAKGSRKYEKQISELETKITQLNTEIESLNYALENLGQRHLYFEDVVDSSLVHLRAVIDFTKKVKEIQVLLDRKEEAIINKQHEVSKFYQNKLYYETKIEEINKKIKSLNISLNTFLNENYSQPILIKALNNTNEDRLTPKICEALPILRERYNDFVTEKIDNLLD
ncbi:MAG: hypothetical protein IKC49_01665 [Clostridia bacterium]|nr:hypothetical protein [Clostridia bacterium]